MKKEAYQIRVSNEKHKLAENWCLGNIIEDTPEPMWWWTHSDTPGKVTFCFRQEKDAMLFALIWQ